MKRMDDFKVNVVLYGLQEAVASELRDALAQANTVETEAFTSDAECRERAGEPPVNAIFCQADKAIVSQLREEHPEAIIVVASRLPEVDEWLNSIEAGANDYCAAPFEMRQIRWILESNFGNGRIQAGFHSSR